MNNMNPEADDVPEQLADVPKAVLVTMVQDLHSVALSKDARIEQLESMEIYYVRK